MSAGEMFLSLTSNAPGAEEFVLVDGPPYTPWVLVGARDMGSPSWQHTFSGPRGTQGRRVVSGTPDDRTVTFGLVSQDQADKDELATTQAALGEVIDEMRRFGGRITWRELNQTYKQHVDVIVAGIELGTWEAEEFALRDAVRPRITATVAPYILWDPYDFEDDFTVDNVNAGEQAYTISQGAGALTNVSPVDGALTAVANLATENILVHTGPGYTFHDCEAQVYATVGTTVTGFKAGVVLSWIDYQNYLVAYVDDNGTNSRIRLDKVVGGTTTNLGSTNFGARMVKGQRVGIRCRVEGNRVVAGYFLGNMRFIDFAQAEIDVTLTADGLATFGNRHEGKPGIVFTPQSSNAFLQDFVVRPFTYRNALDGQTVMRGEIKGDAPAPADLWISSPGGSVYYAFGMFAWQKRREWNRIAATSTATAPWSAAGATGITGAATSVGSANSGKYGTSALTITTPATANVGGVLALYQPFRKGITYTFEVWIRASTTETHNVRVKFGISGDVSTGTSQALSTTWTLHTVEWTPTNASQIAYIAIEQTAATAAVIKADAAIVYEGGSGVGRPTHGRHAQGVGGYPPCIAICAADYSAKSSNLSINATASAWSGYVLRDSSVSAGGEFYYARYIIDPSLGDPDDYTGGETGLEVWARIRMSAAFSGGVTAVLSALSLSEDIPVYTAEHGSYGKRIVLPASGDDKYDLVRLGRLNLGASDQLPWILQLAFTIAAGTNAKEFGIDTIYVVQARSRARGMTAISTAGYPYLIPGVGQQLKVIRSADLSGFYSTTLENSKSGVGAGLHGAPIELPSGLADAMFVLNRQVPETGDATTGEASKSAPFHLAVTPRSKWIRGA